jgi:hypothetical protein
MARALRRASRWKRGCSPSLLDCVDRRRPRVTFDIIPTRAAAVRRMPAGIAVTSLQLIDSDSNSVAGGDNDAALCDHLRVFCNLSARTHTNRVGPRREYTSLGSGAATQWMNEDSPYGLHADD